MKLLKSSNEIVKEIHHAFDSAQERLLLEAKEIINSTFIDNKAERLEKAGFINSERVVSYNKNKKRLVENKEQADLIEYYKATYPFHKFITEEELDRICHKYKLIYAPIENYLKDVPEKNIVDIENAKSLNYLDKAEDMVLFKYRGMFTNMATLDQKKELFKGIIVVPESRFSNNNDICKKYFNVHYDICVFDTIDSDVIKIDRNGLFIAAPKSHFKTKELSRIKFGFFNVTEIRDPIVFRYCKGGVQVITKWGLESEDKLLINEINN